VDTGKCVPAVGRDQYGHLYPVSRVVEGGSRSLCGGCEERDEGYENPYLLADVSSPSFYS
jgi:hypothetical protein